MLPFWIASDRKRIEDATQWVEQRKDLLAAPLVGAEPPARNPGYPQAVRGVLLQSIWGGRTGQMQCLQRSPQKFSFGLSVSGKNIANPAAADPNNLTFQIKVYGVKADDTLQELFTTTTLGIESTADQLKTALILAAQGVGLPVKRTDVQVQLGNPSPSSPFVSYPEIDGDDVQLEVDKTTDPTETYIGMWTVSFSGTITTQFKGLTPELVPITNYVLTDVSAYPMQDSLSDRIIIVSDIYGRSRSYPWKVGSVVACIYFPDIGFGIIGSAYHDMSEVST